MRTATLSLLALCLFGIADTQAQPYAHLAPRTVSGTAALTGTTFQTFVSVGLTATGTVENASHTRAVAFGPWPLYALRRQGDINSPVDSFEMPASFHLDQNYPNPFNPVTAISFSVAEPVYVRLTLYDALGQAVAVLVDEHRVPGAYTVPFDATGLPSGVYVYRIQAGSFLQARKMLLVK